MSEYQNSGNKISCPDNIYTSSFDNCNTLITCNGDKYKYFDSTYKHKNEE